MTNSLLILQLVDIITIKKIYESLRSLKTHLYLQPKLSNKNLIFFLIN